MSASSLSYLISCLCLCCKPGAVSGLDPFFPLFHQAISAGVVPDAIALNERLNRAVLSWREPGVFPLRITFLGGVGVEHCL